ncbi:MULTISPECIES: DUF1127 domain-containing protein [Bradyrhizobium]|uniref:DUF1127 domain-containing protein n=1 Tax=Bradyrhizobium TaxID=374 RepID=UPI000554430F|nr:MULTISPECIES: DUF1127 domain-containing protein [Bradyrhizobium]UFW51799.1 DUF1127 domain-containing protein [Bradyrhizobium arachidis]
MNDVASASRFHPSQPSIVVRAWRMLVDIMRIRRERSRAWYQLAAMTERELQDCGMTRSEIAYELKKPVRRK